MAELISELLSGQVRIGASVTCKGWVRTRRDSKAGLSFIHVSDGSCFAPIQIVAKADLPNYESDVLRLSAGCSVIINGLLSESQGKGQRFEIVADKIDVLGWVEDPETYPLSPKQHSFEHLRRVAHLRPRSNTFGAVARLRNSLSIGIHKYLQDRGFLWVHTPIITSSDSEGAGQAFAVTSLDLQQPPLLPEGGVDFASDLFGRLAHLTVSGQLNVESYCEAMSRVYTFGPTFRAENSNTTRHLAEFWMIEPEVAFADLNDIAELAEDLLKSVLTGVLAERTDDFEFFVKQIDPQCLSRVQSLLDSGFERMTYTEAITRLGNASRKFEHPVSWGVDLQSEHERYICEEVVGRPVVLMNYPKDIKAFYMRVNDDGKTVAAMDVLAPGIGEIVGGSQREERLDMLDARIRATGLQPESYWWSRDLRRYGTIPHSGFGLGLERLMLYLTGLGNIRDVIPFPRTPGSLDF
jgi:asparaginyl-tRNA synthetase